MQNMCDRSNAMSDSSQSSPSSVSQSEGEYILPPDERQGEGIQSPVFDVAEWNPEPPVGLQYISLLPVNQNYDNLTQLQHDAVNKITPSLQNRKCRRKDFSSVKNIGKYKHDEKRLRNAVNSANCKLVEDLLDSGITPCCVDDKKRSPLHIAAAMGNRDIVQLLLERGADPNQKDIIGNTPLHLAACTSHIQVVTLLLQAGTDVNALDNAGNSPLHLACSRLNILREISQKPSTEKHKQEVRHILHMMREYMVRTGSKSDDIVQLEELGSQLSKVTTHDDLDQLNLLLSGFANLQIQKKEPG